MASRRIEAATSRHERGPLRAEILAEPRHWFAIHASAVEGIHPADAAATRCQCLTVFHVKPHH